MKIAQVCPYDMDRPGGVQAHIRDLGTALMEMGHEVTILAPLVGEPVARSGGPQAAWLITSAHSRKYFGPCAAGVITQSAFTS